MRVIGKISLAASLAASLLLAATMSGCTADKEAEVMAGGDEFSGSSLSGAWTFNDPGAMAEQAVGAGWLILALDGSEVEENADRPVTLVKAALEGDWEIDTDLVDFSSFDSTAERSHTGLVMVSGDNWLIWGVEGQKRLSAKGSFVSAPGREGERTEVLADADGNYRFLKIKKRSADGPNTRYYFYYSDNRHVWTGAGFWEDKNGVFDGGGTQYGVMARSWGDDYTISFDYFSDYVPANVKDEFNGNTLDPIWSRPSDLQANSADGVTSVSGGTLTLRTAAGDDLGPSEGSGAGEIVVRAPREKDWIIDTIALDKPSDTGQFAGLIVYRDSQSWIRWGNASDGKVEASGLADNEPFHLDLSDTDQHERFRIRKEADVYLLDWSDDGIRWTEAGTWIDSDGVLEGAKVGLQAGSSGKTGFTATFSLFRERVRPNGAIAGVTNIEEVAKLTGPDSINDTQDRYDMGGADLGSLLVGKDRTYMMFGDNFSFEDMTGSWRSNALAVIAEGNPSDGLTFERMIMQPDFDPPQVKEVIASKHVDLDEMTVIPTGGIASVDPATGKERLYYAYMSVNHWGVSGHWDNNESGLAYSDDGGESWQKADAPKWGPSSDFSQINMAMDANGQASSSSTVYMFGVPSAGFGGVKLMKAPDDKLLDPSAYRYYAGTGRLGKPEWSEREEDAVFIVPSQVRGEIGVMYNKHFDRWIMAYLNDSNGDIEIRDAKHPWGPWSKPSLLVDQSLYFVDGAIYAPYMHPKYTENDGESIYFTMSQWTGYNVYWMKAELQRNEG